MAERHRRRDLSDDADKNGSMYGRSDGFGPGTGPDRDALTPAARRLRDTDATG
ncbi:MAG: hypothetical protein ACK4GG_02520 [Sphingomonas sp.]